MSLIESGPSYFAINLGRFQICFWRKGARNAYDAWARILEVRRYYRR